MRGVRPAWQAQAGSDIKICSLESELQLSCLLRRIDNLTENTLFAQPTCQHETNHAFRATQNPTRRVTALSQSRASFVFVACCL